MTSTEMRAEDVAWNIETLLPEPGGAGVDALLDRADEIAMRVEGSRGRVPELDADAFTALVADLAELHELIGRAGSYAGLHFSTDTRDPARGALMQRVEERSTAIGTRLLFFELEWAALPDEAAERFLGDERIAFARHHLRAARRFRPHLLSEPEEIVLHEKAVTATSAWRRLFEELVSSIEITIDGQPAGLEGALSRLTSPDREVRRSAAELLTGALEPGLRTRAYVYNTLAADKATDDRLRRYPSWISQRNLENDASDASVDALVAAVQARYSIPQRWYALKAKLLGLERLADHDRLASIAASEGEYGLGEARELVLDAYASFSPMLADTARRFFDESWIDAPVRPGKRPGAFCAYTVPSHHPYVLLNWTSKRRDVLTLAHELGHGLHAYLAREQGVFHQSTPLTLAETASVFAETVTFGRLLDAASDPAERLGLLAEHLDGQIATVFRQTAMFGFERAVHEARRAEGELSVERFGDLWIETQRAMLGDAVDLTDAYRSWWSYIPHFIATPGYVYAYSYGQLLALAVFKRYRDEGPGFVPRYVALLSAGGSAPPEELAAIVGVDLTDPGFWDGGLDIIEQHLHDTETAARDAGRI